MEFVVFGVKRSRQVDPHLEVLPSTDNKSLGLVEVGVVLGAVHPLAALHQVYRSHSEEEICGNTTVGWTAGPAFALVMVQWRARTLQLAVASTLGLLYWCFSLLVIAIVRCDQSVLAIIVHCGLTARAEPAQPPPTGLLRPALLGLHFFPPHILQTSQGDGGEASHCRSVSDCLPPHPVRRQR